MPRSELSVTRRSMNGDDMEFLYRVYVSTRDDIAQAPVSEEQKQALYWHQFESQHVHYQKYFKGSEFDVVLVNGKPAGRVYVHQTDDEIRIVDLSLLPEFRGKGVGEKVLSEIFEQADRCNKPLRLRVDPNKPALKWYLGLGFQKIEEEEFCWHMERKPNEGESTTSDE